ncbi:DUF2087 domain-containing protein [Paenibacillus melissococcoides]
MRLPSAVPAAHADDVTLRRDLMEYGFLDRETDGSAYWGKNKPSPSKNSG